MSSVRWVVLALFLLSRGTVFAQAPVSAGAGVAPFERIAGALALIDLRAVAQYNFSTNAWPELTVSPWPAVKICVLPSDMTDLLKRMEDALHNGDVGLALLRARDLAFAARDAGLGVTAQGLASAVAAYAEMRADQGTRQEMAQLIRSLQVRQGATPEYSAQGVPAWTLSLKPGTLFVGTTEAVQALGISEVQSRYANMLDILSQDMATRRDLRVCTWHKEAPDHLVRDYWVLIQRFRIAAGRMTCLLASEDFSAVQKFVPDFNGAWALVRETAGGFGCSTRGAYATWQ